MASISRKTRSVLRRSAPQSRTCMEIALKSDHAGGQSQSKRQGISLDLLYMYIYLKGYALCRRPPMTFFQKVRLARRVCIMKVSYLFLLKVVEKVTPEVSFATSQCRQFRKRKPSPGTTRVHHACHRERHHCDGIRWALGPQSFPAKYAKQERLLSRAP